MAEFKFKCPQCGQTIEADESFRGQTAECPYCGKGIVIPRGNPTPNVPTIHQVPLSKGRADVPRRFSTSFAPMSMTLDKGMVRNTVKTDVDSSEERKTLNILRNRVLTLAVIATVIIILMFSFFIVKAASWGIASGSKVVANSDTKEENLDPKEERFDSKDLSYSMTVVDEWKCEIERGEVNNFEDGFGLGLHMPYDLVAAVMPYDGYVARELSLTLLRKLALKAAILEGKKLVDGDPAFRTDANISEEGNTPSLGAAYKFCGYDWLQIFWFRVKAVYPHQGILVDLEHFTKRSGWRHWAWAFVKTNRHYNIGDKLADGFYIFSGTAKCRVGTENSTRSQQVEVTAFREMNEEIAKKRGLDR